MSAQPVPSAALVAANQRLHQLKTARKSSYRLLNRDVQHRSQGSARWETAVSAESRMCLPETSLQALPAHLGWGSAPLTAVLRSRQEHPGTQEPTTRVQFGALAGAAAPKSSRPPGLITPLPDSQTQNREWVKLYPDIGLGLLRQEMTAPGRLWLMLRFLDRAGQGAVPIATIQENLTNAASPLRLCGRRQLRNLLKTGEGHFWTRGKERLWLRSAARVAASLGVRRLSGKPVALPLTALLGGIGQFRAHLYAAFHSGRAKETPQGRQAVPLARATLAAVSGVGASSQRNYEARVGLRVQANYAVGKQVTPENEENQAWKQGQALFKFKDYRGRQGRTGNTYLAWQLPNSYVGQHPRRPKGRQKRINRALKDLVSKGTPGNVEEQVEAWPARRQKRYFAQARDAVRQISCQPGQSVYWRGGGNGRYALWQQTGDYDERVV